MTIQVSPGPDASETLIFAAQELGRYLSRMLPEPGKLKISLVVQGDDEAAIEHWRVSLSEYGGELSGNCTRAVLLGAYDLLRTLGCRFLAPGAENELVPEIPKSRLALNYEHRARYRYRGVCIEGANSRENVLDFIDWLPKLGFNAFFFQFHVPYCFYARWYEHRANPALPAEPFGMEDARRLMREAEVEIHRRGLCLHKAGHGWTAAVLGRQSAAWDEEGALAEEYLPLAAQVNGARGLYGGVPMNTNLCLSNPCAVERFVELVVDYARAHPEVDVLHIWLADCYNNVCECAACQSSTPSDQYVALLNAIDARLSEEGLPTKLAFLLYQELLWPPLKERIHHPERFILMFAPISRSFGSSSPLDDETGGLPEYRRNHIALPTDLHENLRFLRAWQQLYDGEGFAYDYHLGRAHYGDFGYLHIARVIFGDVERLGPLGLDGLMSCQELRAGMPNFLPNYVMGRALVDGDSDFDELVNEYFIALYGEGWEQAKGFLEALSECQVCDYMNGHGDRRDAAVARKLERVQLLCADFRPAGDAPAWSRLAFHAHYVSLLAEALHALATGDAAACQAACERVVDFINRNELQLQPWLDVCRIQDVLFNYALG